MITKDPAILCSRRVVRRQQAPDDPARAAARTSPAPAAALASQAPAGKETPASDDRMVSSGPLMYILPVGVTSSHALPPELSSL